MFCTSVNETEFQNGTQFSAARALSEVGGTVAHIWPQWMEIAELKELKKKNNRFLTAPLWYIYSMAHILKNFHTFDLKSYRKNVFYKKVSCINAWGLDIFCKFIILHDFWINWALKRCDPYTATPVRIRVKYERTYSLYVSTVTLELSCRLRFFWNRQSSLALFLELSSY